MFKPPEQYRVDKRLFLSDILPIRFYNTSMMLNSAFLFPGQGSQFIGMGKELYLLYPEAKAVLEEVDDALSMKLSQMIFEGKASELTMTQNTQPAIMATSIAVWRCLLKMLGKPAGNIAAGHSLGEYTALCAAGGLDLKQTATLLRLRGQLMQQATPSGGGMLALLGIEEQQAEELATAAAQHGICQIANDNGAGQFVLSGDEEGIQYAEKHHRDYGVKRAVRLNVAAPFHCSLMQPAASGMAKELEQYSIKPLNMPIVHNYIADVAPEHEQIKNLLVQQLCGRVRWRQSMQLLYRLGYRTFLEVGPGRVLSGLLSKSMPDCRVFNICTPAELENYCKHVT